MINVFTSANLAYLPQALVLLDSVRRFEPGATMVLVLVDQVPEDPVLAELLERFDEVITAEELLGESSLGWLFRYDVVEACTSVKGRALRVLLERGMPVVYLDPDTALFAPLDPVREALGRASVVLTPHQMYADPDSKHVDDEMCSLRTGTFNLGFVAVAADSEGLRFAHRWERRLREYCFDDPERGLFTDQKWANLVPALFDSVAVLRHPGMNVASWNIHERAITVSKSGEYEVNGDPLVFFHFTKAAHIGQDVIRVKWSGNPYVPGIWSWYRRALAEATALVPQATWAYGRYWAGDGRPITSADRRLFASAPVETRPVNPFVFWHPALRALMAGA